MRDRTLTPEQIEAEIRRQGKDLDDILALCNSRTCLRRRILFYFGDDERGREKCDNCSNCRSPRKQARRKTGSPSLKTNSIVERELAASEARRQETQRERSKNRQARRSAARATSDKSAKRAADIQGEPASPNLKSEFVDWFRQQTTPKGTPYKHTTISGYCDRIQSTCNGPGFESVGAGDLFEVSDPSKLAAIVAEMRKYPAYAKENERTTGGLNAALGKYAQFLKQRR